MATLKELECNTNIMVGIAETMPINKPIKLKMSECSEASTGKGRG